MSVVRAILGRFARFLVRIARTLDPALATAPYWVMPERMAALRQRYPGAPEHWLELVARRTAIGEAVDPRFAHSEPSARHADELRPSIEAQGPNPHSRPRTRDTLRNFLRVRGRPAIGFPRPDSRSKARPGEPPIPTRTDSSPRAGPSPASRAAIRPRLTFITRPARNPIANLLRIERPSRDRGSLHFPADNSVSRRDRETPGPEDFARREHQTFFPDLGARETRRPEAIGVTDVRPDATIIQPDTRWPSRAERRPIDAIWPDEQHGAVRPDPTFRTQDPRWPDLPRLAVEYGPSPVPPGDDAILLAEQIGGTWSG